LQLAFSQSQLTGYKEWRATGLNRKSANWMNKAAEILWDSTKGIINKSTMEAIRDFVLAKYTCVYAKRKVLYFTRGFLKYLTKSTFDSRFLAFQLFLEMPKTLKTRKQVTSRIVTKEDVENVIRALDNACDKRRIDESHYLNYKALTLFGAFTGQRPLATIARLTVGQFREAVNQEKPFLTVLPEQDKVRMAHYVPLHPQAVEATMPLLDNPRDDQRVFEQLCFQEWLKHTDIRLLHGGARIVNGDLRKFCEQQGDVIQWDQSNKNYILTHGVSGVDWSHYKHPLPEHVYDIYMEYWGSVTLKS
jgi:integrase